MKRSIFAIVLVLVLGLTCLTGCGSREAAAEGSAPACGGTLVLSVNPEIAVQYDENALVTGVTARNDDALAIISSCTSLIGAPAQDAVAQLVRAIGDAGYFVEEAEGEQRRITLEIEPGSALPHDAFLAEIAEGIRSCVSENNWNVPMQLENDSDYGVSIYDSSDYGVSDYDATDYGVSAYGTTDYGVSDYDTTDYGASDYDTTDYGVSNYDMSDYGTTDYSETDYDDSDYGSSDYND